MIKVFALPLYLSLAALIIVAQQPVYFKMCYFIPYAQMQNNYIRKIIMPNALQQTSFRVIKLSCIPSAPHRDFTKGLPWQNDVQH